MAGFSVPAVPVGWRPAATPSRPPQMLQLPSRAPATSAATTPTVAAPAALRAPKKKRRVRNIACVTCNKQKKKCGEIRPCGRCVELGILCQQPIKPDGYSYLTKKRKLSATPPVPPSPPPFPSPGDGRYQFPGTLWTAMGKHQQDDYQPQHLPSPSPSVSTVGTPQPSYTSISSYDDPASAIPASAGKSGDVSLDRLGSYTRPHSVSPDPTEEAPKNPMAWDMSRWDLPVPVDELPDEVVKDSRYASAPIFGLEKPTYGPEPHAGLATFGEPMDLGDAGGSGLGNWEMQGIGEVRGFDAGVAASGVVSGSDSGIAWDTDWLDEVDLSNTDLNLDDVDLSGFDFSCFNDGNSMDLGASQQFAQLVPPQEPPPASLPPPSSLPLGAEDIRPQSPNDTSAR